MRFSRFFFKVCVLIALVLTAYAGGLLRGFFLHLPDVGLGFQIYTSRHLLVLAVLIVTLALAHISESRVALIVRVLLVGICFYQHYDISDTRQAVAEEFSGPWLRELTIVDFATLPVLLAAVILDIIQFLYRPNPKGENS